MSDDLREAAKAGFILLRDAVPEGAKLAPPFLRYDAALDSRTRAAIVRRLLDAEAAKRRKPGDARVRRRHLR